MRWLVVALVAWWCTACAPASAPSVDAARQAIVGGALDATSSTVFLLDLRFNNGDAAICSAVLITPRVLLSAAHCVDPSLHSATSVTVNATNKPDSSNLHMSDLIAVSAFQRHPSYNPSANPSDWYDFSVMLLASAPAVTPTPIIRTLPSSFVGSTIRLSGYGRTAAATSDSGARRTVSTSVTSLSSAAFEYGVVSTTGTCSGDSGGPSLLTGGDGIARVVGIHSNSDSRCGAGMDQRVDDKLAFIDAFVAANDPALCTADGRCATGCSSADPDCPTDCGANGVCATGCATPDPDCRCLNDGRCDSNCAPQDPDCVCVADGTCEASCPNQRVDPDCGCQADSVCVASCAADPDCADCGANGVCASSTCTTPDPDCLLDGAVCESAALCVGHQCLDDRRGFKFCSRSCVDSSVCELNFECRDGLCREPLAPPLEGAVGGCSSTARGFELVGLLLLLVRRKSSKLREI